MLQDIYFRTPFMDSGNITFEFTGVTREDETLAQSSESFMIQVFPTTTGNSTFQVPKVPIVTVDRNVALEDERLVLNISMAWGVNETTNPSLSLIIHNLNSDLTIRGAYYNPYEDTWVVGEASLEAGRITIEAPADFSGDYDFEIQAIATNADFESATTELQTIQLQWDPAGDGLRIQADAVSDDGNAEGSLLEDTNFAVALNFSAIDRDGSETQGDWVIIEGGAGFAYWWEFVGFETSWGPFNFTLNGETIINGYNVSLDFLRTNGGFKVFPYEDWHGQIPFTVYGFTTELLDSDVIAWSNQTFTFDVEAVADPAILSVQTISIPEYNQTSIYNLLSARVKDLVAENGPEQISVKFTNVPAGSQFYLFGSTVQYGGFTSAGVYSIPSATALPFLELRGPQFVSGSFNITLSAVTYETSNYNEFLTEETFTLILEPVASQFLILSEDIDMGSTGVAPLVLNVRVLDQNGTLPGENPAEVIELYFDLSSAGDDSVYLRPTLGGRLTNTNSSGMWTFQGTQEQANAIELINVKGPSSGKKKFGVDGRTIDIGVESEVSTDDFDFEVKFSNNTNQGVAEVVAASTFFGTIGNDFLRAMVGGAQDIDGGDGSDIIFSSVGVKTLSGGLGADQFVWPAGSVDNVNIDRVTDFIPTEGDQLNIGALLTGFSVQQAETTVSSFVFFVDVAGGHSELRVSPSGTGSDIVTVAVLERVQGLDADVLYASGNLLL